MVNNPPDAGRTAVPRHVAVIMDGNGRWAKAKPQPRAFGHRAGVRSARRAVRACHQHGVEVLTLFAFSQENWQRPANEVTLLMQLFVSTLSREINSLHRNGVRLRFIGNHADFAPELLSEMARAEALTASNTGLVLVVALGYGGHWDITQAARKLQLAGTEITQQALEAALEVADLPAPDLMIRTGGEQRISNFLLWQLAYAELYFSDVLWPDFGDEEFSRALAWYTGRERRFGRVPEAS